MAVETHICFLFLLPLAAWAGTSADYSIDPTALDGGGALASSAAYTFNPSTAPGVAGASANYALRSGYAGQLLDLVGIAIDEPASPMTLNERAALQLAVTATCDDATKAVVRAVAIVARLGDDATAAVAAHERLPPDPVFGDRPDTGPTTLVSRSTGLLARIFPEGPAGDGPAVPAVPNWIATRWSQQWQGQVNAVAAR
jgi:hypothetical protein